MGSFHKLLKTGASGLGFAVGGPVGSGLANFGTSILSGSDPVSAAVSGASAGAAGMGTDVVGSVKPSFGSNLLTGMGFGGNGFQNVAQAGNLLSSLSPGQVSNSEDFNLLLPAPKRISLLDTLNGRSQ